MGKVVFYMGLIFLLYTPSYAFDITLDAKQNIYNNDRIEDAQILIIHLKYNNFLLFNSYEAPYLRLMGQGVTDYKIFGIGIGYDYEANSLLLIRVSSGIYFTDTDIIYTESHEGKYNEGIRRYLNRLFADPDIRFWNCYDIETKPAIGLNLSLQLRKDIENFSIGCSFGYRFLRIPIRIIGWDIGHKYDSDYGWWQSTEMEDLSCAHVGLTFGYRF